MKIHTHVHGNGVMQHFTCESHTCSVQNLHNLYIHVHVHVYRLYMIHVQCTLTAGLSTLPSEGTEKGLLRATD